MMVEMVTDYNKNEWVNLWTGDTIIPPNNQDRFFISILAGAREQSVSYFESKHYFADSETTIENDF